MKKIWKKVTWKLIKKDKLYYESRLLRLNSNKAKKILNWRCILTFDETIRLVSSWYKMYYEKNKNHEHVSINQIKFYEKFL